MKLNNTAQTENNVADRDDDVGIDSEALEAFGLCDVVLEGLRHGEDGEVGKEEKCQRAHGGRHILPVPLRQWARHWVLEPVHKRPNESCQKRIHIVEITIELSKCR